MWAPPLFFPLDPISKDYLVTEAVSSKIPVLAPSGYPSDQGLVKRDYGLICHREFFGSKSGLESAESERVGGYTYRRERHGDRGEDGIQQYAGYHVEEPSGDRY